MARTVIYGAHSIPEGVTPACKNYPHHVEYQERMQVAWERYCAREITSAQLEAIRWQAGAVLEALTAE